MNRARFLPTLVMVVIGSVALGSNLSWRLRKILWPHHGPRAVLVSSASQTAIVEDQKGGVDVDYQIRNVGDRDLMIGSTTTSCGCSVVSAFPRIIAPGQSSSLTVHGSPPALGEREVQIAVETNDVNQPRMALKLILIGKTPLPLIGHSSGPVQFGVIESDQVSADFYFDTHELKDRLPWPLDHRTSLPGLTISDQDCEIVSTSGDAVGRRHRFRATYLPQHAGTGILGSIHFFDRGSPSVDVFTIPVQGIVRPPVYPIPPSFDVSLEPNQTAKPWKLSIKGRANEALQIAPILNPNLLVKIEESGPARIDLLVTTAPGRTDAGLKTTLGRVDMATVVCGFCVTAEGSSPMPHAQTIKSCASSCHSGSPPADTASRN